MIELTEKFSTILNTLIFEYKKTTPAIMNEIGCK